MEGDLSEKPHVLTQIRAIALGVLVGVMFFLPASSNPTNLQLFQVKAFQSSRPSSDLTKTQVPKAQPSVPANEQGNHAAYCSQPQFVTNSGNSQPQKTEPSTLGKHSGGKDKLHALIEQVASQHNVDPALIKAIIMAESGYNPKAVSKKGAIGLMQLMPSTAEELGVKELFNPKKNIEAGVKYFKRLLRRFDGDVTLALAAYNAGSTKVRRYRGVPPIGATRYYVKRVFHYYKLYKKEAVTQTDA